MKTKILTISLIAIIAMFSSCIHAPKGFYEFAGSMDTDKLKIRSWRNGLGTYLRIEEKDSSNLGYILAKDNYPLNSGNDKIGDSKFDEIHISNVEPGSLLWNYARMDSINKIYYKICEKYDQLKYYPNLEKFKILSDSCNSSYNSFEEIEATNF